MIPSQSISENFYIRKTKNYGNGIFANVNFKAGDFLFYCRGEILKFDEIDDDSYEDHHCLQIDKYTYIGPSGDESDFINHSCNPNGGIKEINGQFAFLAIKNIERNEEITFDYSTSMDENHSEYICHCSTKLCRGVVQDFRKLPDEIRHKYLELGIVLPFISKQYHYS